MRSLQSRGWQTHQELGERTLGLKPFGIIQCPIRQGRAFWGSWLCRLKVSLCSLYCQWMDRAFVLWKIWIFQISLFYYWTLGSIRHISHWTTPLSKNQWACFGFGLSRFKYLYTLHHAIILSTTQLLFHCCSYEAEEALLTADSSFVKTEAQTAHDKLWFKNKGTINTS